MCDGQHGQGDALLEMAAMVGTVREVVGQALEGLEEEGPIWLERHGVVVPDREALRQSVDAA